MLNFFYRSVAKSEMNLLAIKNRIDIYLKKGNERNVLAKRNIIASFGIKIIGIIISLILVPMTVNYVWGIERSGFFNGREKWAKGFENQRV